MRRLPLPGGGQSFEPEFPNRLKHSEPRAVTNGLHPPQQMLFEEGRDPVKDGGGRRKAEGERTSSAFRLPSSATASAASGVKPPPKTARLRKRSCSAGGNRV